MKAVIFDLDGTLVNSAIYFREMKTQVIRYLKSTGVAPNLLNNRMLTFEITAAASKNLLEKGLSESRIEKIFERVSEIMNRGELDSLDAATLREGVPETLSKLRAKGLKLGIITRGCRKYAELILAKFELRKFFDAVVARDDVENPKPDPEHALHLLRLLGIQVSEALFVGDHWSDAECAKKAGIEFVFIRRKGQNRACSKSLGDSGIKMAKGVQEVLNWL